MNTLKNLKAVTAIAFMALFFACSQDDEPGRDTMHRVSTINITAADFASDNPETRTSENGYVTTFTSGDKIGVTVISNVNAILQDNIPCTYDGTDWTPDGGAAIYNQSGAAYLAYYPYSAAMSGKKTVAEILAAFTPKTNQSAYADYTASDLMTGTGTISGTRLTIGLAHALALVEVSLPARTTAVTLKAGTTDVTPYKNGNSYRYIAKPQASITLSGGYTYLGATWTWQKTGVALTAGQYTKIGAKAALFDIRDIPLAFIPKGTFQMGSPSGETGRYTDETQHQVTLTKDFYMSRYEITNAQYAAFLNANSIGSDGIGLTDYGAQIYILDCTQASRSPWGVRWNSDKWAPVSGYENFPVIYVSWFGAKAFADWAGGSLPTEAQWEYACRAGTTTAYSYGDSANGGYMWYGANSGSSTHAVGTTTSGSGNAWGLYDMHGNVREWCADWYYDLYYNGGDRTDPTGSGAGSSRVLRGGYWGIDARRCRSAYRYSIRPDFADYNIGFRVVFVP